MVDYIKIKLIYDKKIPILFHLAAVIFLLGVILPEIDSRIHDDNSLLNNNLGKFPINNETKGVKHQDLCFYADPNICFESHPPQSNGCECFPHHTVPRSLVCCNITNIEKVNLCANLNNKEYGNSSTWLNIHIRNATLDELDVSNQIWKQLNSLVVTDGYIKKVAQSFKRFSTIKCLNFSHNNMTEINPRAFKDLTSLQLLDISYNNISIMPNKLSVQHNLTVDVSRNQALLCKSVFDSIDHFKFINQDSTFCLINKTYSWFNATENLLLSQLKRMKHVHTDCPSISGYGNCSCLAERMSFLQKDDDTLLVFTVKVDCSGLGLIDLPRNLPKDTLSLNVSRNKIKSLAAFTQDSSYQNILRLDADDNEIESILELEGTRFIDDFQQLNLRKNKLKSIPIYIISNTLDKNPRGVEVHLGGNRLHCDCNTAKILRLWLLARQTHIVDFDNIQCDNMPSKVVELSEMKLCQSQHDWTDYIYYLIAAEIFLLLALVMKVSYDYCIFKTSGYLPWPANKMPKLPCDWLCES